VELGVRAVLGVGGRVQEHAGAREIIHATTLLASAGRAATTRGATTATTALAGNHTRQLRKRGVQRTDLCLDTRCRVHQVIGTTSGNKRRHATTLAEGLTVHGQRGTGATSTLLLATVGATTMRATAAAVALGGVTTGHWISTRGRDF
jgi:hypothetical protein